MAVEEVEVTEKLVERAEKAVDALEVGITASSGRTTLGPFVIKYKITSSEASVRVDVKVGPLKTKILSATLTRRKKSASGSARAGIVKAAISVTADFDKMRLAVRAEVCHKKLNGKWRCKGMSATIG